MQRGRQDETPTQFGPLFDRTELASAPLMKDASKHASSKAKVAVLENPLIVPEQQ